MQRTFFLRLVSFPTFQMESRCRALLARTSSCDRSPTISSADAADVAFETWWASDGGNRSTGRCRRCHPEYTREGGRELRQIKAGPNVARQRRAPQARITPRRRKLNSPWKLDNRFLPIAKLARPQAQQAQRLGRTKMPHTAHSAAIVIGHLAFRLVVGMASPNKPVRRILRPHWRVNSR